MHDRVTKPDGGSPGGAHGFERVPYDRIEAAGGLAILHMMKRDMYSNSELIEVVFNVVSDNQSASAPLAKLWRCSLTKSHQERGRAAGACSAAKAPDSDLCFCQACQCLFVLWQKLFAMCDGQAQVAQSTICQTVDPAMHCQTLSALPGTLDNRGLADVCDLLDYIEFAQALQPVDVVATSG
jgi:hypothetical protein